MNNLETIESLILDYARGYDNYLKGNGTELNDIIAKIEEYGEYKYNLGKQDKNDNNWG